MFNNALQTTIFKLTMYVQNRSIGLLLVGLLLSSGYSTLLFSEEDSSVNTPRSHRFADFSTFVDRRDSYLIRQSLDFSCGAAALATLLTYYWGDPVSEVDVLRDLSRIVSSDELEARYNQGFSLYDLQRVAIARGYRAAGFEITPEQLQKLTSPVIVFIQPHGFKHFAILRGIAGNRAVLADPSRGNITVPLFRFYEWWLDGKTSGVIFTAEPMGLSAQQPASALRLKPGEGRRPEVIDVRSALPSGSLTQPSNWNR